jgi:TonB family protein
VHGLATWVTSRLPNPKKLPERIEVTLQTSPQARPAPSTSSSPPAPQRKPQRKQARTPPPTTSPVVPERPPSEDPPEDRAQLPVVERSPAPAPPPAPSTWKERMLASLAETRPKPLRMPTGDLLPTDDVLERVAAADPRLHDEENERRLMEDFGPFFRRGLEALRGNWHPDEVLRVTERDPQRRCGRKNRTTFAIAVLDREGNVVDVELKNPSGCSDLDEEAVAAFKRVAKFPYPPAGIFIGPDGSELATARYPVRFIVTFDGGLRLDWRG